MRRFCATLLGLGLVAVFIAIPLWHVTRWDSSGCQIHNTYPCDGREYLPYGSVAGGLIYFGIFALVLVLAIVLVSGFAALIRRVRALEAEERAARRAAG